MSTTYVSLFISPASFGTRNPILQLNHLIQPQFPVLWAIKCALIKCLPKLNPSFICISLFTSNVTEVFTNARRTARKPPNKSQEEKWKKRWEGQFSVGSPSPETVSDKLGSWYLLIKSSSTICLIRKVWCYSFIGQMMASTLTPPSGSNVYRVW